MSISRTIDDDGVAEIVMDNPPVNALTVAGWFELADTVTAAGNDDNVRAVVLRAEGRGFNAGVDVKLHYPIAIHQQQGFPWGKQAHVASVPNAERNAAQCVSLPMFPELTNEEVDYTIEQCLKWDKQQKK